MLSPAPTLRVPPLNTAPLHYSDSLGPCGVAFRLRCHLAVLLKSRVRCFRCTVHPFPARLARWATVCIVWRMSTVANSASFTAQRSPHAAWLLLPLSPSSALQLDLPHADWHLSPPSSRVRHHRGGASHLVAATVCVRAADHYGARRMGVAICGFGYSVAFVRAVLIGGSSTLWHQLQRRERAPQRACYCSPCVWHGGEPTLAHCGRRHN